MKKCVFLLFFSLSIFLFAIKTQALEKSVHMTKGQSYEIDFSASDEIEVPIEDINFTTSDKSIALVEDNIIKAIKDGQVTITGYHNDLTSPIAIKVYVFTSMVYHTSEITLDINEPFNSDVVFQPSASINKNDIAYTSQDVTVAIVSDRGTIVGQKVGKTKVIATLAGQRAEISVNVEDKPDFEFIEKSISLQPGSSTTVPHRLSLFGDMDKTVRWASENTNVAYVDNLGIVYASKPGSTNVVATVNNNSYKIPIVVESNIESINFGQNTFRLAINEEVELKPEILPKSYEQAPITYSSSKPSVAIVSNNLITARSVGETIITARVNDIEKEIKVIVDNPLTGLSVGKSNLLLHQGDVYPLLVTPIPSDSNQELNLKYASSNEKVATVDEFGNVQAKEVGTSIIFINQGKLETSVSVEVTYAQDDSGSLKVIGAVDNGGKVTFDTRSIENIDNTILEIPFYNRLDSKSQRVVKVVLNEDVFIENHFMAQALVLSTEYNDKDVIIDIFNQNNDRIYRLNMLSTAETQINILPSLAKIQSDFSNLDGEVWKLSLPIQLSGSDRLEVFLNNSFAPALKLFLDESNQLREVRSNSIEVVSNSHINLYNLPNQVYYLTDIQTKSRIVPFVVILISIFSAIAGTSIIRKISFNNSIEDQQEEPYGSVNYKQKFRSKKSN